MVAPGGGSWSRNVVAAANAEGGGDAPPSTPGFLISPSAALSAEHQQLAGTLLRSPQHFATGSSSHFSQNRLALAQGGARAHVHAGRGWSSDFWHDVHGQMQHHRARRTTSGVVDFKYSIFETQDVSAWVAFGIFFLTLVSVDLFVLNRKKQKMSLFSAGLQTVFWIGCSALFCGFLYEKYGRRDASQWASGYLLEWMLSFDNLFVFHLIFRLYATPEALKHKPLMVGICGAVLFRLAFIAVGELLMNAMWAAHLIFGLFLVYTGVRTIVEEEEDEDPTQFNSVKMLQKFVPFVGIYDKDGSFFVRVPVDEQGNVLTDLLEAMVFKPSRDAPEGEDDDEDSSNDVGLGGLSLKSKSGGAGEQSALRPQSPVAPRDPSPAFKANAFSLSSKQLQQEGKGADPRKENLGADAQTAGSSSSGDNSKTRETTKAGETPDGTSGTGALTAVTLEQGSAQPERTPHHYETRATMLFLVVVCLEVCDLIFAVDSVSAIVAQVSDLFLAYTSTVFAMLGIRCVFFIVNALSDLFSLLKFGVSLILVLLGLKLVLSKVVDVSPEMVCLTLFLILSSSIFASVIAESCEKLLPSGAGTAEDAERGGKKAGANSDRTESTMTSREGTPVKQAVEEQNASVTVFSGTRLVNST